MKTDFRVSVGLLATRQADKRHPVLSVGRQFFAPCLSGVLPHQSAFFASVRTSDPPRQCFSLGTDNESLSAGCVAMAPYIVSILVGWRLWPKSPNLLRGFAALNPIRHYLFQTLAQKARQAFWFVSRPFSFFGRKHNAIPSKVLPDWPAPPLFLFWFTIHVGIIPYTHAFLIIAGIIKNACVL